MKLRRPLKIQGSNQMYTETEIKKLIQQTVSLIPEHTWPVVADQLSARIVDTMPSEILVPQGRFSNTQRKFDSNVSKFDSSV